MRQRGAPTYNRTRSLPRSPFLSPTKHRHPPRRTPRARRHLLVALLFMIIVAVAVLLWALAGSTSPGHAALRPRPVVIHHHVPKAPPRPSYGWQPAPPAQRIAVRLKLPLVSGVVFNVHTGAVLWQTAVEHRSLADLATRLRLNYMATGQVVSRARRHASALAAKVGTAFVLVRLITKRVGLLPAKLVAATDTRRA